MTDEQIVKALEICNSLSQRCGDGCPYYTVIYKNGKRCSEMMIDDTLALIKRQQAEIVFLKAENEGVKKACDILNARNKKPMDVAIKEFAERLKSRIRKDIDEQGMFPLPYTKKAYDTVMIFINNLAKEMTEKEGGKG